MRNYTANNVQRLQALHKTAVNGYCLGFGVWDCSDKETTETLYAVCKDGKVLTSTHTKTNEFDEAGREWKLLEGIVPETAEFIGIYKQPTAKVK